MFDTDQAGGRATELSIIKEDGLINVAEFTQMVQFVTVAGWLETEAGGSLLASFLLQEGKSMVQQASVADQTFQDL